MLLFFSGIGYNHSIDFTSDLNFNSLSLGYSNILHIPDKDFALQLTYTDNVRRVFFNFKTTKCLYIFKFKFINLAVVNIAHENIL